MHLTQHDEGKRHHSPAIDSNNAIYFTPHYSAERRKNYTFSPNTISFFVVIHGWLTHHHADFKSPFSRIERRKKKRSESTASTSRRERKHYNFQPFCTRVTITTRAFFVVMKRKRFLAPRKLLSWKVMVMVKW